MKKGTKKNPKCVMPPVSLRQVFCCAQIMIITKKMQLIRKIYFHAGRISKVPNDIRKRKIQYEMY
jgi:hypothetical protein